MALKDDHNCQVRPHPSILGAYLKIVVGPDPEGSWQRHGPEGRHKCQVRPHPRDEYTEIDDVCYSK